MIVMCVCHCDETNSFGGLEKQAYSLARELKKSHKVIMLSSTKKMRNVGWGKLHGVDTLRFWTYTTPQVAGKKLPASLIWAFQLLIWLILNKNSVEVFHCHQIRIHAFVAGIINKFFNVNTILKSGVGGTGADINAISTHKYFGRRGQNFVKNNNSKFVSITNTISNDLKVVGIPQSAIEVIPNGIDTSTIKDIKPDVTKTKNNLVYLGRIDSDKNVDALVNAALSLRLNYDFQLSIFGNGELRAPIEDLISTSLASDHIKIFDYVEDVPAILKKNCWFILPSNAEGLSNAMIEAMTCGVVPIVSKVSGAVDHIEHNVNGYFMEGVSESKIKEAMLLALNTSEEKWIEMSNRCKTEALNKFEMQKVVEKYRELYRTLGCKN